MCGPLAARSCAGKEASGAGLYALSRSCAYFFVGALSGMVGATVLQSSTTTLGTTVSLVVAATLLAQAIVRWRKLGPRPTKLQPTTPLDRLKKTFGRGLTRITTDPAALGLLTGFMPCGALAAALVVAASSGSPLTAGVGMLAFSITSSPGPLGVVFGGATLRNRMMAQFGPRGLNRIAVAALLGVALWTAARPWMVNEAEPQHCALHQRTTNETSSDD